LSREPNKITARKKLIIDLLLKWSMVYHFRGAYSELIDLIRSYESLAQSLNDSYRLGMLYVWLGSALRSREKAKDAYRYLSKALELGEATENKMVIGYASAWLSLTCADLGLLNDGVTFGLRAKEISSHLESDHELFRATMQGLGTNYFYIGQCNKTKEIGMDLLDYGRKKFDTRSSALGYETLASGHLIAGDFNSAIECYQKAIKESVDPIMSYDAKTLLGYAFISNDQIEEAEKPVEEVIKYSEDFGTEIWGSPAQGLLALITIAKGNLGRGMKMLEDINNYWSENNRLYLNATSEYLMGKIYFEILYGSEQLSLLSLTKNIGFLVKNIPFASKKVMVHFERAIEIAKEIGTYGFLGQIYLDFGLFYKAKKRTERGKEYISKAIELFKQCEAEVYLKKAKDALASLR